MLSRTINLAVYAMTFAWPKSSKPRGCIYASASLGSSRKQLLPSQCRKLAYSKDSVPEYQDRSVEKVVVVDIQSFD
jgi:hypothetical protein